MKYDRFLFFTDIHLANNPPVKRIDNYNESILEKVAWVVQYAQKNKIRHVICSELFHTHKTSDELTLKFVDLVKDTGIQIYYLFGNHDIQAGNVNFIDKTNMGFLCRYPWFCQLDERALYEFQYTYLTGINYSKSVECQISYEWYDGNRKQPRGNMIIKCNNKKMILVTHAMITNKDIIVNGVRKSVCVKDVETNADLLLNGHFHDGHKEVVKSTVLEREQMVCNPGSIARMNLREATEGYGPRIADIKVNDKIRVKLVNVPCKPVNEIFDVKGIKQGKREVKDKNKFIKTLRKMGKEKIMGENFEEILQKTLDKPPKKIRKVVNKSTRRILLDKLEECR